MSEPAGEYRELKARERLLWAANQLFYAEGVNTVGIDRIIEHAGVAKASLYNTFGSKDALVRAYLEARQETRRTRILQRIAPLHDPQAKILAIFDDLGERAAEPGFRGCAFVRASAETREGSSVTAVCEQSRSWLLDLFRSLARDACAPHADEFARQLMVLYEGAAVSAQMDGHAGAVGAARSAVELLLPR